MAPPRQPYGPQYQQPYGQQPYAQPPPGRQAPMGISLSNMSKTAMMGMACGLGAFFSMLIGVAALQLICGVFALIFGIMGAIIGGVIWRTERPRAIVILFLSVFSLVLTLLVIAYFYA